MGEITKRAFKRKLSLVCPDNEDDDGKCDDEDDDDDDDHGGDDDDHDDDDDDDDDDLGSLSNHRCHGQLLSPSPPAP